MIATLYVKESSPHKIEMDGNYLAGDVYGDQARVSLLMMHGAGNADRSRFMPLRRMLLEKGIASSAFDFIGCGESTGKRENSTLQDQTKQACRVIQTLNMKLPLTVVGASMAAYTAVKLLDHFQVANLILIVPAMYTARSYNVPFNRGFTHIIRQPQSWIDSDAWELLGQFTGNLLVIEAEKDAVIPKDVLRRITHAANKTHAKRVMTIQGAPHKVLNYLNHHGKEDRLRVVSTIAGLMNPGSSEF